jgi:hypothetical protein
VQQELLCRTDSLVVGGSCAHVSWAHYPENVSRRRAKVHIGVTTTALTVLHEADLVSAYLVRGRHGRNAKTLSQPKLQRVPTTMVGATQQSKRVSTGVVAAQCIMSLTVLLMQRSAAPRGKDYVRPQGQRVRRAYSLAKRCLPPGAKGLY